MGDAARISQDHFIPMPQPIRITVTGAAGNVGYALSFCIATGSTLGPEQPVDLVLLDIPPMATVLEGVALELEDCALPLLNSLTVSTDPREAFRGTQYALLVGSKPRTKGARRGDLIESNLPIFVSQGQALNECAADDVRIAVVGNPANLNCLLAQRNAPDIPPERFSALTRLDHDRALGLLARHTGVSPRRITNIAIWGNHSATQYPCLQHARIDDHRDWPALRDETWIRETFIPCIQQRGAEVIEKRGQSSAASAANAISNHVRSWHQGTPEGDSVSMAVLSQGEYGTPPGVFFSFPVTIAEGNPRIVPDLPLDEFDRGMIEANGAELVRERSIAEKILS